MSQTLPTTMAATVRASNQGLELVDKARCKKGWAKTEKAWADLATTSKATLRRFWGGLKIQTEAFQAICEVVGIKDWASIADFDSEDDALPKTYEKRLSFAIAGSIEEIDKQKLDAIVALLRKLGGDAEIEILDIEKGSVKLTLGGSEESLQRLQELFDAEELKEVEGLLVQDVHFLTKEEIIESIKKNGGPGADLSESDLRRADLRRADLRGADLRGADLSESDLRGADLSGARLIRTNLRGANLRGTQLFRANLIRANLRGANPIRADLSEANLSRANLSRANLSRANLSKADLFGAQLFRADLSEAQLFRADLSEAQLFRANLSEAQLFRANLSEAQLIRANLSEANLSGANLSGANLYEALVEKARFINTQGLSVESKEPLIQRGAIFEDDPNSRDRVLVPR